MKLTVKGKRLKDGTVYPMVDEVITTANRFVKLIVQSELLYGARVDSLDIEAGTFTLMTSVFGDTDITEVTVCKDYPRAAQIILQLIDAYQMFSPSGDPLKKEHLLNPLAAWGWIGNASGRSIRALSRVLLMNEVLLPIQPDSNELVHLFEFLLDGEDTGTIQEIALTQLRKSSEYSKADIEEFREFVSHARCDPTSIKRGNIESLQVDLWKEKALEHADDPAVFEEKLRAAVAASPHSQPR